MRSYRPEASRARIHRREFLATTGAAIAIAACSRTEVDIPEKELEFLIIGGGLTGLAALDRLRKAGRRAHLLEASDRLGGRIYTKRDGLPAGLRAEMGAERVLKSHHRVLALLKRFHLETLEARPLEASMSLEWDGQTHRYSRREDLPEAILQGLSAVERRGAPRGRIGSSRRSP